MPTALKFMRAHAKNRNSLEREREIQLSNVTCSTVIVGTDTFDGRVVGTVFKTGVVNGRSTAWLST
jgi:hypothetical protein